MQAQEVVLRLTGITKRFGPVLANDGIDLALHRGEVVALLGENGAGKTTLMNILFGQYRADAGDIQAFGVALPPGQSRAALMAGIGMVHQHFTQCAALTVLENIMLGRESLWQTRLGRAGARARLSQLMGDFGLTVDPDARVADLSVGERQRVEILKALYGEARVLILDEPTAVLTPQEAEALFVTLRRLVAQGLSVLFISHKLGEVMALADRCVVLRHGCVAGAVRVAETNAAALAAMMVGGALPGQAVPPGHPGAVLLSLRDVGGAGVDLDLRAGTITGLAGVSGNGQAALADLISGLARPLVGQMTLGGHAVPADWSPRRAVQAGVGRIPEDRHRQGVVGDFTLAENAVLERYGEPGFARGPFLRRAAIRDFAAGLIGKYDVRGGGPDTSARGLSGGNMQKVILGRVLEARPKIILANQPVRGLDVGAIAYVQSQLIAARDQGAAVLLISEDLNEVLDLSDVVHVISKGRLSPGFARGEKTVAELGLWMAGEGFDHAA
jgi:ABC-type uncharacterized transport system ATPase subunit